jgi:ornithine cyclodeaminase/alanine dehydrogenase-like protein (mu-crystallin family)
MLGEVNVAATAEAAVQGAEVVITAGPILLDADPPMRSSWLGKSWLLLPIDFDLYVSPELTTACDLLLTDDVHQFEYYREQGYFSGWQSPSGSVGQALETGAEGQRVIACNLGVAALDAAFAQFVLGQLEQSTSEA